MNRSLSSACMVVIGLVLVSASQVSAQATNGPALRKHEIVAGASVNWTSSYPIGDAMAKLRGNAAGPQPPPFTLFTASSEVESLAGIEANVGYAIGPSLVVEAHGAFSRPQIAVSISGDPEANPQSFDGEALHQVILTAGVVWQLPYRLGRQLAPFVTTGLGHLRQLHEERTLVETGRIFYLGAGTRYFIKGGNGRARSMGVRGDVHATWRNKGIDFETRTRLFPTFSAGMFVGF